MGFVSEFLVIYKKCDDNDRVLINSIINEYGNVQLYGNLSHALKELSSGYKGGNLKEFADFIINDINDEEREDTEWWGNNISDEEPIINRFEILQPVIPIQVNVIDDIVIDKFVNNTSAVVSVYSSIYEKYAEEKRVAFFKRAVERIVNVFNKFKGDKDVD